MDEADVVARRTITVRGRDGMEREATIRIGKPHADPDLCDWSCDLDIVDADGRPVVLLDASGKSIKTSALKSSGIDGFQAIALAMLYARGALARADVRVFFLGVEDRAAMIERPISGSSISMRCYLEQLVDDELDRISSQLADPATSAEVRARFPADS